MESDHGPKRRQDRNPGPVAKNLHLDHDFPIFGMILCGVEGDRVVDVKSEAYVDGQTDRAHTGSAHTGSAYTGSARIDRAHDEAMDVAAISRGRPPRLTGCPWHDVNEMLQSVGLRPTRQRMALGWLLFGKGPAPYAPAVISDNMGDNNGLYTDLVMTPGGWVSTSYDVTNDDLYLLRQSGGSWNSEDLATGGYGGHARLEPFRGTGLICVYLDDSTNWYCSVYDGSQWFQQVMLMPIVKPATGAELVVVNDVPYFLVEETESTSPNKDKIMCVTGVIPPFGEL